MSLQFIIDGYNIIHNPAFIQEKKRTSYPQESLLKYINNKRLCGKNKITVVFDGYPPKDFSGIDAVNAVFSRKESADESIKRILESHGSRGNIVVVSDDNEVRFFSKGAGARVLSVDEFMNPKKKEHKKRELASEIELSFSQMEKINKELRKIWLE